MLDGDSEVFKSMGPVLMNVDLADAKVTVDQRLKHLRRDLESTEKVLTEKEKEREEALKVFSTYQDILGQLQQTKKGEITE